MTANTPYDRDAFFTAVLDGLGLPATPWRLNFFRDWARYENTGAGYNPLATTRVDPAVRVHSFWNDNGGNPVKNYASFMDGVVATVQTLNLDYYQTIRASLAAERVLSGAGAEARTWGTMGFADLLDTRAQGSGDKVYLPTRVSGPPVPHDITLGYLEAWEPYYTQERPHLGLDFGCPVGTPFTNPYLNPVKVRRIQRPGDGWGDGSLGVILILDIGYQPEAPTRFFGGFAHLSEVWVNIGDIVPHGAVMGLTGESGFAKGAHLHWQHSVDENFSRGPETEHPLSGLNLAEPGPIVIEPPIVSSPHAVERLNYAITLRNRGSAIFLDPDLAVVERAADALRAAGFTI